MKKPALSPLTLMPKVSAAIHSYWEQTPEFRLLRAAKAVRAGQAIEARDRAYVFRRLMDLYDHEHVQRRKLGEAALRAAVADHISRECRLSRETAAHFVVTGSKQIPAVVRAIARVRQASIRGKKRK